MNLISILLTIDPYNSLPFSPITVSPSNTAIWNNIFYDYRNAIDTSGNRKNIIFLNLSESVLHLLDPALSTYSFHEGDNFQLILHYQVCGNYFGDSRLPDDNRFISNVAMNMYLTAVDLPSLGIFSAYSDNNPAYPTAVNCINPQSNWLYNCQTANGTHTFYSLNHHLIPGISNSYNNSGPSNSYNKCHKSLLVTSEIVIGGGDLYNVFPNEFRAVPAPVGYRIHLPQANLNYTLQPADIIGSKIRTYNEFGCLPFNRHEGIFNTSIISVIDSQITFSAPISFIDFN